MLHRFSFRRPIFRRNISLFEKIAGIATQRFPDPADFLSDPA